jgi:hypothetical protein
VGSRAPNSVFLEEDGLFIPTEHARGPWDPRAMHGGAPAALIAGAFECMEPGSELRIGRLSFEFLRPIPDAPLGLSTSIVRAGRRAQELAAELYAGEELICRANALRVKAVPAGVPRSETSPSEMAPVESGQAVRFALDGSSDAGFAVSAMHMRWLSDPFALGPGRVWMRLSMPISPGQELTPLTRLVATADFGNGVSAALPFDRFLFINADLTIHLHRPPTGEWVGLDAQTYVHEGGSGLAESVLHDARGAVGRAFQTLVVEPRSAGR